MATNKQIKKVIENVILEARKKKAKKKQGYVAKPSDYSYSESLDMSTPQGDKNLYKVQGASNWGPYTSAGEKIKEEDDESVKESIWNHPILATLFD